MEVIQNPDLIYLIKLYLQYISIEDGLAQTIDWYSKYRDFWEADKLSVEQNYAKTNQ